MKWILIYLVLSVLASALEPKGLLTKALTNQQLEPTECEELTKLVFGKHDQFLRLLSEGLDGEAADKAKLLLPELTREPSEDEGQNHLGAAIGWNIQYHGNDMVAYPIITKVRKDSVAAKAGLKLGDVISKLENKALNHDHSRNRFIDLLKIWPSSTPMKLEVRRHPHYEKIWRGINRRNKVQVTVNFGKSQATQAKESED